MITVTQGQGSIIRHCSGRYFSIHAYAESDPRGCHTGVIVREYRMVSHPLDANVFYVDRERMAEIMGREMSDPCWGGLREQFEPVTGPGCACCGERRLRMWRCTDGTCRCDKHQARNPCAVEGCKRTTAAKQGWYSNDTWLCGDHWKAACPPRSTLRRAYHRIWRLQKKVGEWTPELDRRYWTLFRGIVARARGRSAGDLDMAEIEKLFGWAA